MVNFTAYESQETTEVNHLSLPAALDAPKPSFDSARPQSSSGLSTSHLHVRPDATSRRGSTSSTYSEQAEEEAHLSKQERVRLALIRMRGPQYEELTSRWR